MRSLLFVPADSERKLARSLKSGADALILDLEDSVMPANRPSARSQARTFLDETQSAGIARYVRINALASDAALDDLTAVLPGKPEGILLPKCLPEDLSTLDHYLSALETAYGLTPGGIRAHARRDTGDRHRDRDTRGGSGARRSRLRGLCRFVAAACWDHLGCRGFGGLSWWQQSPARRDL
jgi:hypothetical protein